MTIKFSKVYQLDVIDQVRYIYKDKPRAALKFRKDYISVYKIDLKQNSILVFGFIKYRNSF